MVGIFCCLYVIFPDSIHLQVIVLGSTTVCFSRQFYTEHHDTDEKNGSIISVVGKTIAEIMELFLCIQKVPYDL